MQFINTQIRAGVWQGDLVGTGETPPDLRVTHLGAPLEDVTCLHDLANNVWRVRVPIPLALISDGVQTFVISDASGHALASFALLAGDALAEDIRAEVDLLRAELDLLKSAFRAHCNDRA